MITVKQGAVGGEFYFVRENGAVFAFFYKLSTSPAGREIWAVSGRHKPLAANVMDFDTYDDALAFIEAHAPSRMKAIPH